MFSVVSVLRFTRWRGCPSPQPRSGVFARLQLPLEQVRTHVNNEITMLTSEFGHHFQKKSFGNEFSLKSYSQENPDVSQTVLV